MCTTYGVKSHFRLFSCRICCYCDLCAFARRKIDPKIVPEEKKWQTSGMVLGVYFIYYIHKIWWQSDIHPKSPGSPCSANYFPFFSSKKKKLTTQNYQVCTVFRAEMLSHCLNRILETLMKRKRGLHTNPDFSGGDEEEKAAFEEEERRWKKVARLQTPTFGDNQHQVGQHCDQDCNGTIV